MPSNKATDLTGQVFVYLKVIERVPGKPKTHGATWKCRCECGNVTEVPGSSLKSGNTTSCGCLRGRPAGQPAKQTKGDRYADHVMLGLDGSDY